MSVKYVAGIWLMEKRGVGNGSTRESSSRMQALPTNGQIHKRVEQSNRATLSHYIIISVLYLSIVSLSGADTTYPSPSHLHKAHLPQLPEPLIRRSVPSPLTPETPRRASLRSPSRTEQARLLSSSMEPLNTNHHFALYSLLVFVGLFPSPLPSSLPYS